MKREVVTRVPKNWLSLADACAKIQGKSRYSFLEEESESIKKRINEYLNTKGGGKSGFKL